MPLQTKSSVGLNFNLNCAKHWQFDCRHSDPSKVDFQRRKEGNFKGESKSAPTGQRCCNILRPVSTCTMGCAPFGKVCTLACCQLRRPASAAAPSVAHSCPQLPTSPHSIAIVLLERRCCGRYLSFSCQVRYIGYILSVVLSAVILYMYQTKHTVHFESVFYLKASVVRTLSWDQ